MKRIELDIEHLYKGQFVGRHRLRNDQDFYLIGAARDADIRLLGDECSSVHAVLELREEGWCLCDLGSEQGTWVKKQPIVEEIIRKQSSVQIGGHLLKLHPREIEDELFKNAEKPSSPVKFEAGVQSATFHQVVVRRKGFVVGTHLLDPSESFVYRQGSVDHSLNPPKEKKWQETQFGEVLIQQRLADSGVVQESEFEKVAKLWDPGLRAPLITALAIFLLMMGFIGLMPDQLDSELKTEKPAENKYSKIIFDAKIMKKKKAEAKKLTKQIAGRSQGAQSPQKSAGTPKSGGKTKVAGSKTIKSIRASGLGALIGKISKRASKRAVHIESNGRSADDASTGAALGAAGGARVANAGRRAGGIGTGKKLGGVQTAGKGGGSNAYRGVAGLAVGNIGNASVGVLEEETEVQGGLDREVIARIIKSQIGQIRYCYERQLSANPDLYGKVQVKFTIGASGSVATQSVGNSSLNNAMVEGCILRRVAGWQFPQPKGGTKVVVTYPFLFKSTR